MTTSHNRERRPNRLQPAPPPERPASESVAVPPGTPERQVAAHAATVTDTAQRDVDSLSAGRLPPMGVLLARPILLLVCALVGALFGFALSGNGGYQAQAVLEFNAPGTDSVLVKQTGQTLARTAVSADVIQSAQKDRGEDGGDLADRASAEWASDTKLVTVTVTAATPDAAVADANAVAQTVVSLAESSIRARLAAVADESDRVLNSQQLSSAGAEAARQSQLGSSLASRQDAIAAQSGDLSIADPATVGTAAGLSKSMGAAVGLVAGLLLGGLVSLLLGLRGLRVYSERTLRAMLPGVELSSPSQAAQLAGEAIESGRNSVAVIFAKEAADQAIALAEDITAFLRAHGKSVTFVGPIDPADRRVALDVLRHDIRDDVRGHFDADMLVLVVPAESDAAALLQGQSNLRALVVIRRRSTLIASALRVMESFGRAEPVLVLAR